jgi:NADH:ubiquinone oxidoreductase subunit F (NADH-binding)
MNEFSVLQKSSLEEWQVLQTSPDPVIYIGMGSCGLASGARDVWDLTREILDQEKLKINVLKVGCIGPCYLEPFMDIQKPGLPRVSFNNVNEQKLRKLIPAYLKNGKSGIRPLGHLGDIREPMEGIKSLWEQPMLKLQERVVLRNCGIIDPENIKHYIGRGGFTGLLKSFELGPGGVIEEVKTAGLRGRGGAGFPTWKKWQLCQEAPGRNKYLICNADEGDPGAFMNRSLMEGDPYSLLEGMIIAAYAIQANHAYIYIRAEYPLAIDRLKLAMIQMHDCGLLGENILGSGFGLDIRLKEGAGAFVCGEETALIASVEGRRGMPRSRPPYPASSGLNGSPTNINNVETLATIPNIMREGGKWFAGYGSEKSKGTKTFALVGKVRRTGLIEVPMGTSLREIIFDIGGGTRKEFKAVQTGGPSGGCLSKEFLDLPVDYESRVAVDSSLWMRTPAWWMLHSIFSVLPVLKVAESVHPAVSGPNAWWRSSRRSQAAMPR